MCGEVGMEAIWWNILRNNTKKGAEQSVDINKEDNWNEEDTRERERWRKKGHIVVFAASSWNILLSYRLWGGVGNGWELSSSS